jgi:CubicO group peptidase (beta-lactamase class C family)
VANQQTLLQLPAQPNGVPWPTEEWPTGPVAAGLDLDRMLDEMFGDPARFGDTYAVVVVHEGRLIAERYGGALPHLDRPEEPVTPATRLLSWSMAKSILHAAVGVLVGEGTIAPSDPAPVQEWQSDGDGRAGITLEHLLTMRDGLDFAEDYVDDRKSDVIEMLFGSGRTDVAHYAATRPLAHRPGEVFNYSSGTSNIVARIVGQTVGGRQHCERFLAERIFEPIGMRSTEPQFDDAGTFVGSSYVYATARDFARFGLLYLRGGVWNGDRLLPAGWVDHGRTPRSVDPADGRIHGAHWWIVGDHLGSFWASGYDGQSILCVPALDLVVTRLGKSPEEHSANLSEWRASLVSQVEQAVSVGRRTVRPDRAASSRRPTH